MLQSERIELAIYRYVKLAGSLRSTTIGELAAAVHESHEDVAERLKYLHSEGHAKLWKYAGPNRLEYSEKGKVVFSPREFFYTGGFQIELTPSGRKYFDKLEVQNEAERKQPGASGVAPRSERPALNIAKMPKEHHDRDYAIAAMAALAEYLAVIYGAAWLAWLAAFLLWLAFYNYTNRRLFEKSKVRQYGSRILVTCVLAVGTFALVSRVAPNTSGPLGDWQKTQILQTLSQYPGQKVLILFGVGNEAAVYANQFRNLFLKAKWRVDGPRAAPINQMVLDVQVSADNRTPTRPEVLAVLSALKSAGVKCRSGVILDSNVPWDLMVLWAGAKTPPGSPEHVPLSLPPTQNH